MFNPSPNHVSNWNRDERNIYTKVFAGFLFATDEAHRRVLFEAPNCLREELGANAHLPPQLPRPRGSLFISFDNHVHDHLRDHNQCGEFADVAIWGDEAFVTIEAKAATDWTLAKDIVSEIEAAAKVATAHGLRHLAHCLIIADHKWVNVRTKANASGSAWTRLQDWLPSSPVPLVLLTWRQIGAQAAHLCGEPGADFQAWLDMQIEMSLRKVQAMPPSPSGPV